MPPTMVANRLRLNVATTAAIAPAIHSLGPPDNKETDTSATIKHPGKAWRPGPTLPILATVRPTSHQPFEC